MMRNLLPYIMITLAAIFWGLIAIFVKELSQLGFTAMEIVTIRVTITAIILLCIQLLRERTVPRLNLKDVHIFIGTGIISIVVFNWCYFKAIEQMNVSIAVILLYTAPAFVTILSILVLKESFTLKKLIAVLGTILGCVLIAGVSTNSTQVITLSGVLIGLGSGFCYALYSIFGKFALNKYNPFVVTLYTFIAATIFLVPITQLWKKAELFQNPSVWTYGGGLALFSTVLAFILYTTGLKKIESSKASIIATIESIVATLVGVYLFQETIGFNQLLGSIMIIISVLIVNLPEKKNPLLLKRGARC